MVGRVSFCSTPSLGLFRPTPSLAGTQQQQQQQQQQYQHLHQQEYGSAAAAPTARMRRVQQPMLQVSSNISCDYVTCLSPFSQRASPPGFHVTYIPKGNLVIAINYANVVVDVSFWIFTAMPVSVCPVLERLSRAPPGHPRPRVRARAALHSSPRGRRRNNGRHAKLGEGT